MIFFPPIAPSFPPVFFIMSLNFPPSVKLQYLFIGGLPPHGPFVLTRLMAFSVLVLFFAVFFLSPFRWSELPSLLFAGQTAITAWRVELFFLSSCWP